MALIEQLDQWSLIDTSPSLRSQIFLVFLAQLTLSPSHGGRY